MSEIIKERVCAEVEGDVVVFLIGMRINKPWKFWKWLAVANAMPKMLKELSANPELGMLSARAHFGLRNFVFVQYWKSAAHLQAFALAANRTHLPEWQAFNKNIGSSGDVGIWHETYVVPRGHSESVYVNMPRYGLGLAGSVVPGQGATSNGGEAARGHAASAPGRRNTGAADGVTSTGRVPRTKIALGAPPLIRGPCDGLPR